MSWRDQINGNGPIVIGELRQGVVLYKVGNVKTNYKFTMTPLKISNYFLSLNQINSSFTDGTKNVTKID